MNFKSVLITASAACFLITGAYAGGKEKKSGKKLLDPANMDTSVKPGDNFFLYANGAWLKNNPVPPTETRWGSFNELQENNFKALHALLTEAAAKKHADTKSAEYKVGAFYRTGMDTVAIEQLGMQPVKPLLSEIDKISNPEILLNTIAKFQTKGMGVLFGFYVFPDDKNVTKQVPQFYQGGLGLPDRDYYFNEDARSKELRNAYRNYLRQMMGLIGVENPSNAAEAVYKLETQLARASMTRVDMRDPYKLYNKFTKQELAKNFELFDWTSLTEIMRIGSETEFIIGQPEFFKEVGKQMKEVPVETWKNYLKFHVVNDMAPYLSSRFADARFAFYGTAVRGQQEQQPRWKRVLQVVDGSIGELLGQMYVSKHFKPEAKERMLALVNNLQETYAERIKRLDWMSEPTKQKALAKLNTFMKKIGYPDEWKDYKRVLISDKSYVDNVLAAAAFEYDYNISKLGLPVNRAEWHMTPPTVNAYYNPAFNEIVFPAGILQYPFFDFSADDAVNYGGIGAVIGHEMTHGFDDQGRQYDADGNLNDWWTPEDADQFNRRAQVVERQFNDYAVLDTVKVNGKLTLGENLADLGGLSIALEAFKKTEQYKSRKKIDGFSPEQRFFLSWAQVWRANTRPEELASRIVTDPHSPNEWRTNGPLSNMSEFYEAFNVRPGDKMYLPENQRANVW